MNLLNTFKKVLNGGRSRQAYLEYMRIEYPREYKRIYSELEAIRQMRMNDWR